MINEKNIHPNKDDFMNLSINIQDLLGSLDNDDELSLDLDEQIEKRKLHLCSHAPTCKFKKDKAEVNKCMHTRTCEFHCEKFISKTHIITNMNDYRKNLNEAIEAKKTNTLRFELNY